MSNQTEPGRPGEPQSNESFGDILKQFERDHSRKKAEGSREATVISVTAESVVLDIGFKTEGVLPIAELRGETLQPGDKLNVAIKGRDPEGYYLLTRGRFRVPRTGTPSRKLLRKSRPFSVRLQAL